MFQFQFKHTTGLSTPEAINQSFVTREKQQAFDWMSGSAFHDLLTSKSIHLAQFPRFLIFGLISNRAVIQGYEAVEGTFVVAEGDFGRRYPMVISAPLLSPHYQLSGASLEEREK